MHLLNISYILRVFKFLICSSSICISSLVGYLFMFYVIFYLGVCTFLYILILICWMTCTLCGCLFSLFKINSQVTDRWPVTPLDDMSSSILGKRRRWVRVGWGLVRRSERLGWWLDHNGWSWEGAMRVRIP